MKGLVYKDVSLFASMWKSYVSVFVIFLVLTLAGVYDTSFLFMLLSIMLCMYPATSFSYDELAKWDRFVAAAPDGRRKTVGGKYLFALLLAGMALAAQLAIMLILVLLGKTTWTAGLFSCMGGVAGAVLINAVLLPLLFRFGAQKARITFIAVAALGGGGVAVLLTIGGLSSYGSGTLTPYLLTLLPLAALAVLFLSYRISLRIYLKKEF